MRQRQLSIAKITRPRITGVYERKRLFKLLDQGRASPIVWISGPAGSGKTTLVGSYLDARNLSCLWYQVDEGDGDIATFFYYLGLAAKKAAPRFRKLLPLLTPEYAFGIPVFTRRFFEELFSRLNPPSPPFDKGGRRGGFVIVFDNYHHIPEASPLHEILQIGLSTIPEGVTVIVTSRAEPPAMFSGLRANKQMELIGWEALRLTPEESRGIVQLEKDRRLPAGAVAALHEKAGGWAAGLILMAKGTGVADEPRADGALRPEETFDYFASELFEKADEPIREFLLRTAVLPKMTPDMAEKLTKNKNAGTILAGLNRRNYFTEKRHDPSLVYQYHPLFREFLRARVNKVFSPKYVITLQVAAARLLEDAGQIEDAAFLFISAESWASLANLIAAHAQAMLTQGRHGTLREWIERLPQAVRDTKPYMLYWHAHGLMPFQPGVSRALFEQAYTLFNRRQDRAGMFLSLCSAFDMSLQEGLFGYLDRLIALLQGMLRKDRSFPSPELKEQVTTSMFNALAMRQPWNAAKQSWDERAFACLRQSRNKNLRIQAGVYLTVYHFYMGNMAKAAHMLSLIREEVRSGDVSPLLTITVKTTEAIHDYIAADFDSSLKAVAEGLRLADETGVHVWDNHLLGHGCGAALSIGDLGLAEEFLRRMQSIRPLARPLDIGYFHFMSAWHGLLSRDLDRAFEQAGLLLEVIPAVGFLFSEFIGYVMMAQVQHERGNLSQASKFLELGRKTARRTGSTWFGCMSLLAEAHITFGRAENAGSENTRRALSRHGTDCLQKALAIGREQGIANIYGWRPDVMAKLCARALALEIEVDYVRDLIRKRRLVPDAREAHVEAWPWPVKIYALGRFRVDIAGKPLTFSGKVQKKPLEMLKVLVAFGGDEVAEGRITDALWPEAEGDAVRLSFKSALHRLRQLIGNDEAVRVQDGKVSLDRRYCWADVWAFEKLMQDAEAGRGGDGETGRTERARGRRSDGESKPRYPRHPVTVSPRLRSLERAVSLYAGRFLPGEEDKPWSVSLRERLRNKFLRAVGELGESSERDGKLRNAVEYYQKGLEADDLAEELYRRLMLCYQKRGRKADAVKAYERCRKVLAAELGVEPSEETERVYAALRTGQK